MPIVIVSYRREYQVYCGGGQYRPGGESDFRMYTAKTPEQAAELIANQIHAEPEAKYTHLLFERWEDVVAAGESFYADCEPGEKSVSAPGGWSDYDQEDWNGQQQREDSRKALCAAVTALVTAKLGALSEAAKSKAEEERRRKVAQQRREMEAKDRADYERLKIRFENGGDSRQ